MFEQLHINNIGGKKIYFASDFHLGSPNKTQSKSREEKIISWLDSIKDDCHSLFLLGDIFDFWFEYQYVVPKGFVRFQSKLAEFTDNGIPVYMFTGNHDMWMFDYFEEELGVKIYRKEIELITENHIFLLGHGDGLGPKDYGYKFFRLFFHSKICQWLFGVLNPNIGIGIAKSWSNSSRKKGNGKEDSFLGDQEWILQHCREQESMKHRDYYIYGHRHLVIDTKVNKTSKYINLGAWYSDCNYAEYNSEKIRLIKYS